MEKTLEALEQERNRLYRRMMALGDFRPGTISINYRTCGKDNCACAKANHPGHGPQYLWSAKFNGRSVAENLRLGPHLEKVRSEVETYRTFEKLREQIIAISRDICRERPIPEIRDENKLNQLKKKLQRIYARKFKRRRSA